MSGTSDTTVMQYQVIIDTDGDGIAALLEFTAPSGELERREHGRMAREAIIAALREHALTPEGAASLGHAEDRWCGPYMGWALFGERCPVPRETWARHGVNWGCLTLHAPLHVLPVIDWDSDEEFPPGDDAEAWQVTARRLAEEHEATAG